MEVSVDGLTAFAATGGRPFDASQPVLVFVHGAGMDRTVWSVQARRFAHAGWSVLAVDLPGHGRSEGTPPADIGAAADWLLRFLDAAGVTGAVLAGHSMGALTVLEAAARGGAKVRGLALLGVATTMPVHPDLLAAAQADDHLAIDLVAFWGHGRRGLTGGHASPGLWMSGAAMRLMERGAPGLLHNGLAICNAYAGALDAAAQVACPTLLLLGAQDQMTPPRRARDLAAALAHARTVILPDTGHMMMIEVPTATTAALDAFLKELA
ncbi:MAG: alpha/beta hydrolase [Rhodobacterales bacterium]|nr:alpha/beta hydrolase [Rhodobacterales bacterium]